MAFQPASSICTDEGTPPGRRRPGRPFSDSVYYGVPLGRTPRGDVRASRDLKDVRNDSLPGMYSVYVRHHRATTRWICCSARISQHTRRIIRHHSQYFCRGILLSLNVQTVGRFSESVRSTQLRGDKVIKVYKINAMTKQK